MEAVLLSCVLSTRLVPLAAQRDEVLILRETRSSFLIVLEAAGGLFTITYSRIKNRNSTNKGVCIVNKVLLCNINVVVLSICKRLQ